MIALGSHIPRSKQSFLILFVVLLLGVILSGCQTDLPQSTLYPAGDVARDQKSLFVFIFWIAAIIFVIVQAILIFIIFRFRRKSGEENAIPRQTHGHTLMEIGWTLIPVAIVVAITIPTIQGIAGTYDAPEALAEATGTLEVEVVGHQWWWEYRYLDENGDLDFVTANEMHIPTNTVINLTLMSEDVIHSFSVPRLAGTRDAVPGRENRMWFNATEEGIFAGQCKEFCGTSHTLMRTVVFADSRSDYAAWADTQRAPAVAADQQDGWAVFQGKGCIGCHTVEGTAAAGTIGPDLTHFGSRITIAANTLHKGEPDVTFADYLENPERDTSGANLASWLADPPGEKPGSLMPNLGLSNTEITSLVAFLEGLE